MRLPKVPHNSKPEVGAARLPLHDLGERCVIAKPIDALEPEDEVTSVRFFVEPGAFIATGSAVCDRRHEPHWPDVIALRGPQM